MLSNLGRLTSQPKKLADHVYETLSDAIIDGKLAPGERLREAEVAEALGVSRTPVRETFAVLQRQHLLEQDVSGAYHVAQWDEQMLWEVAILRAALEGLAIDLAAKNLTPADLAHLQELVQRMTLAGEGGDHSALEALNMEFHSYLWSCSGHLLLQESLERMKPQIRYFVHVTPPLTALDYAGHHQEVLTALQQGDHSELNETMQRHIISGAELAISLMEGG